MTNTAAPRRPSAQAATQTETIKDFHSGADYTADKAKSVIDDARTTAKNVTNNAGDRAANALKTGKKTYRDAKGVAQQNVIDIERQILERPVQATLIAAGVGFLVGTLLMR